MTTIDTKALALRVADEADAQAEFCLVKWPDGKPREFHFGLTIAEARALAAFLREAVSPWRPLPPPNNEDIIVLHDNDVVEFISAEDNDYRWNPDYGPKIKGMSNPMLWMPLPTPPAAGGGDAE